MDTELVKKYLDMFKVTIAVVVITIVVSIALLAKIIPDTVSYFVNKGKYTDTEKLLVKKKNELDTAVKNKEKMDALNAEGIKIKSFYKSISSNGNSTADILAGEISEINDLIKYYGIKIYKVDYEYDPANDIFYKEKKDLYSVCSMKTELFASYMKFQSFLKDLYKYENFLDIQTIEINPYKKDKSILCIKMDLNLYAEKDPDAGKSREVPSSSGDKGKGSENLDMNIEI